MRRLLVTTGDSIQAEYDKVASVIYDPWYTDQAVEIFYLSFFYSEPSPRSRSRDLLLLVIDQERPDLAKKLKRERPYLSELSQTSSSH